MRRLPPKSTRTDTRLPDTTLSRSHHHGPWGVPRVLRLLHGEADQVVGGGIDLLRRLGVEPPRVELWGLVARADGSVRVLAFEPAAHRRALAVDQPRRLRQADQGAVVARTHQLEIGRAHVCTPVTNAQQVRLL